MTIFNEAAVVHLHMLGYGHVWVLLYVVRVTVVMATVQIVYAKYHHMRGGFSF